MNHSESSFLGPRTAARVVRDVQELLKTPEAGVRLVVDEATGLPANLRELTVRVWYDDMWMLVVMMDEWIVTTFLVAIHDPIYIDHHLTRALLGRSRRTERHSVRRKIVSPALHIFLRLSLDPTSRPFSHQSVPSQYWWIDGSDLRQYIETRLETLPYVENVSRGDSLFVVATLSRFGVEWRCGEIVYGKLRWIFQTSSASCRCSRAAHDTIGCRSESVGLAEWSGSRQEYDGNE